MLVLIRASAHPAGAFLYNRKYNLLLYKNVLVRYRTRTTYIVVPPYFTDSLRLPASLSRIHSLSTLTGASRHSLLVPASEYISLTFFLIVRLLILHGSGFRCAALGCIRSLFPSCASHLPAALCTGVSTTTSSLHCLCILVIFSFYPAVMLTDLTCFCQADCVIHLSKIYIILFRCLGRFNVHQIQYRLLRCKWLCRLKRNILHEHDTISASGYL